MRFSCVSSLVLFVVGVVGIERSAQSAAAQTVQLPTFNYTSVGTTVLVPDRGMAYLGGVGSAASGRTSRGIPGLPMRPFTNTGTSRTTGAGGMWVSAQIHDLQAMDEALLNQAGARSAALRPPFAAAGNSVVNTAPKAEPNLNDSIQAIQATASNEDAARQAEAAAYLERAQKLLAEGKPGVAKVYFQMAATRASGDVKTAAQAGIAAIERGTGGRVAGR